MAIVISPSLIRTLIEAGNHPDLDSSEAGNILEELRQHGELNTCGPQAWRDVCEHLSVEEISSLLRALVIAEREFGGGGVSVASAIWIFGELVRRDFDAADRLSVWIIPRRTNPYVPFGTYADYGARSLREYRRLRISHEKAHQSELDGRSRIQAFESRIRRLERRKVATEHEARSLANRLARETRVFELIGLSPVERLERIARDTMPADYWPAEFAGVGEKTLKELNDDTRGLLAQKLRTGRTPAWRALRRKLTALAT